MRTTYGRPLDVPRALRALRALANDPDETSHVFTIIDALSGRGPDHLVGLFETSTSGRRLLAAKPSIVSLLADRDALRAMPPGSLAHAYLAFVESEGITADGLIAASDRGRLDGDVAPALAFVSDRMRDTHDLWHAATGYRGDVLGEAALLAFNIPQTRNLGVAAVAVLGLYKVQRLSALLTIVDGLVRGARAEYLPAVDWEALLPLPLEVVRDRLALGTPPVYQEIRSSQLRAEGKIAPRATASRATVRAAA